MVKNNKVYIIAEIGTNHNGSLDLARKTIKSAAKSGVDAVKFQSFKTEEFMANKKLKHNYKTSKGIKSENMYKMFERLEFKKEWYLKLSKLCRNLGIDFLSSAADIDSAKILKSINSKAIKIASEDIINYPLLKKISKLNKRVILSTGMADQKEVEKAVLILKSIKKKLTLLHCVSLYPTPEDKINLNRILALKERYKLPVGFSDHTIGINASLAAVVLGACVIEKHFTLDKKLPGPDHMLSSDPPELTKLVNNIRQIEKMIGSKEIRPTSEEIKMRQKFRRSIVANQIIKKGTKIISKMLSLKRPGTGIHPMYLNKIIGKISSKTYYKNEKMKL